mgnify:CR=1 FL=1
MGVPISSSAVVLVGVNSIAAGIINTAKAAFLNEVQKRKTQVISGDPFQHSRDFAARFDRLPPPTAHWRPLAPAAVEACAACCRPR